MQFSKFSLVVLLTFASTGLAQLFAPRSPDCTAVKYVVIDSHEVQLYDENIHGQGPTLRLFDKLPSADCYRKQKKRVPLSARTDLYLRDSRTSLMIYDRGLFDFVYSFGKSLLKLTPFAFISGALSIIECSLAIYNAATKDDESWTGPALCMSSLLFLTLGTVFPTWQSIANALPSGTSTANTISSISASPEEFNALMLTVFENQNKKRDNSSENANLVNALLAPMMLYHSHNDQQVHLWELFMSNITHPINVYHHGKFDTRNTTVRMWTEATNNTASPIRFHNMLKMPYGNSSYTVGSHGAKSKRCNIEYDVGQDEICEQQGYYGGVPSGAPDQAYFGYDLYGTKDDIDQLEDDFGTSDDGNNGYAQGLLSAGEQIYNSNAWDTCICTQNSNGDWISTGSLQLSWDDTYNGYSQCWETSCGVGS